MCVPIFLQKIQRWERIFSLTNAKYYTTQIKGKKYENIKILDPKEIYEFIMNSENDNILPEKAIRWREVLMEISK